MWIPNSLYISTCRFFLVMCLWMEAEVSKSSCTRRKQCNELSSICSPRRVIDDARLSMICALFNKAPSRVALASGACQKPWCTRLPATLQHRTNGGRDWACSLVPASGVFCQNGSLFSQSFRILRLVSTLKPLHIVIHSLDLFNSGGILSRGITSGLQSVANSSASSRKPHASAYWEHAAWVSSCPSRQRGFLPSKTQLRLASLQSAGSASSVCCAFCPWIAFVLWRLRLLSFPIGCLDTTDSKFMLSTSLTP